jgi:hypothetical protein
MRRACLRAAEGYAWPRLAERVLEVYREVVAAGAGPV